MEKKKEVCVCVNCGNEAEMSISCSYIDVEEDEKIVKKKKETRKCSVCGNEADMIVEEN